MTVFESQGPFCSVPAFQSILIALSWEMGSVSSSLKSKLLFVWWLKIRCLAFLKVWLNLDRRYIGWDQATCQVQWKEWFRWYLLYKGEVMLYEEEMLRQQLQRQKNWIVFSEDNSIWRSFSVCILFRSTWGSIFKSFRSIEICITKA